MEAAALVCRDRCPRGGGVSGGVVRVEFVAGKKLRLACRRAGTDVWGCSDRRGHSIYVGEKFFCIFENVN